MYDLDEKNFHEMKGDDRRRMYMRLYMRKKLKNNSKKTSNAIADMIPKKSGSGIDVNKPIKIIKLDDRYYTPTLEGLKKCMRYEDVWYTSVEFEDKDKDKDDSEKEDESEEDDEIEYLKTKLEKYQSRMDLPIYLTECNAYMEELEPNINEILELVTSDEINELFNLFVKRYLLSKFKEDYGEIESYSSSDDDSESDSDSEI